MQQFPKELIQMSKQKRERLKSFPSLEGKDPQTNEKRLDNVCIWMLDDVF